MPVVSTDQDREALTFTIVTDLAAPPSTVWQIWSDPRLLERWWGPPTWPATFLQHELVEGGSSSYVMTGPEGERAGGWWRLLRVDEPSSLEFEDGFSDADGRPDDAMPTTSARVDLVETASGTRMTVTSRFGSVEQLDQLVSMGMVEGMRAAMGQIDGLLVSA